MIKFAMDSNKGAVFGFGLLPENISDLMDGKPITINLAELGGPTIAILICYTESHQSLFEEFQEAGLIDQGLTFKTPGPGESIMLRTRPPKRTDPT